MIENHLYGAYILKMIPEIMSADIAQMSLGAYPCDQSLVAREAVWAGHRL